MNNGKMIAQFKKNKKNSNNENIICEVEYIYLRLFMLVLAFKHTLE